MLVIPIYNVREILVYKMSGEVHGAEIVVVTISGNQGIYLKYFCKDNAKTKTLLLP